jgi:hypothetical protein
MGFGKTARAARRRVVMKRALRAEGLNVKPAIATRKLEKLFKRVTKRKLPPL